MLVKSLSRYWLAALTMLLTSSAVPSRANVVIGNLAGTHNNNNFSNVGQGLTAAMGFTTGSSSISLTDVELVLTLQAPASDAPLLQLRSNASGAPGVSLLTFTNPTLSSGTDLTYTFTPSSAFTLQANTTYWLYLTSSSSTGAYFEWAGGNPAVTPTGSGATYSGTTTGVVDNFQIDGQPAVLVPEPSTLFIVVATAPLSGLGFWCFKRRRRVAA